MLASLQRVMARSRPTQIPSTNIRTRAANTVYPRRPAPDGTGQRTAMLLSRQRAMAALGRWRMLNAGFTTPRQIEELLDVPLLTSVNRMDQRDLTVHGKAMPIPLLPTIQPLSRYSESLRALRSGIAM